jgi:CDP-diacylglycerol--glycerol-3-phosphate 3-phosphatidyltransferase
MTLADKVTSSRLIMAPVFFVIYLLPRFFPSVFAVAPPPTGAHSLFIGAPWTVPALWFLFVASEITDMLDGMIARKRGEVSDFGKLYDPFADTLTQITYFFCFVIDGILPPLLFLAVLYREFSILFIRNLMLKKGIAMGARMGGKIKTVTYILAGGLALLASSLVRLGIGGGVPRGLIISAEVVFLISVIIAVVSFFDYVSVYSKTPGKGEQA